MKKTLKSIAFLVAGGTLLAASSCTLTDLLNQLLGGLTSK
jgi:hypothetical protein